MLQLRSWSPLIFAALLLSCGLDHAVYHTPPEMTAIMHVIKISGAEQQFYKENGRYGTLAELGPGAANSIPGDLASGRKNGYSFHVTVGPFSYLLQARPSVWDRDGRRSFLSDETGEIHQSWEDRPATILDEIVR